MLVTFLDCLWIISEILHLRFRFRLRVGSGAVGDLANAGFHAPCAESTKGWPTAAKERSPSFNQLRATRTGDRYLVRASLAAS